MYIKNVAKNKAILETKGAAFTSESIDCYKAVQKIFLQTVS